MTAPLLAAWLAALGAASAAGAEDRLELPSFTARIRIDLPVKSRLSPSPAPSQTAPLSLRFGDDGVDAPELGWAAGASAALFALAALNAFAPAALSPAARRLFTGQGRPADSLSAPPAGLK